MLSSKVEVLMAAVQMCLTSIALSLMEFQHQKYLNIFKDGVFSPFFDKSFITSSCHFIGQNSHWEAENPNFLVIWPTDKCEGSKWGRIWPGIQWAWSQTCDTSPCPLIGRNSQWEAENPNFPVSWPTDKCEGSKWGRI